MKEACLSIISYMLMDSSQKRTIQEIYKYMDKSGDGKLQADEIYKGIRDILKDYPEELIKDTLGDVDLTLEDYQIPTDMDKIQWCQDIIDRVDIDGEGHLDYNDFLLGSIPVTEETFRLYCANAYELLFSNDHEQMEIQEFVNLLCQENNLKETLVKDFLYEIERIKSLNIGFIYYQDFFVLFAQKLGIYTDLSLIHI